MAEYRPVMIANCSVIRATFCVKSQKSAVTEQMDVNATENAESYDKSTGGGLNAEAYGFGGGVNLSKANKKSTSNKTMTDQSVKMHTQEFIKEKYNPISPGKSKSFACQGQMAYISVKIPTNYGVDKKVLDNFNTFGSFFIFDGQDLDEIQTKEEMMEAIQKWQQSPQQQQLSNDGGEEEQKYDNTATQAADDKILNPQDSRNKPNDLDFSEIRDIFVRSQHPEFKGFNTKKRQKLAAVFWKQLKKDKKTWGKQIVELKQKHEPYISKVKPGQVAAAALCCVVL